MPKKKSKTTQVDPFPVKYFYMIIAVLMGGVLLMLLSAGVVMATKPSLLVPALCNNKAQ